MAINFKDIRNNFFTPYKKYWIIFFVLIVLYFLNSTVRYFYYRNKITLGIDRAVYVSNGVAINRYYVLANKKLIDDACVGLITGKKGDFFVITKERIYPAFITNYNDARSNMVLLRITDSALKHYAIIQIDQPVYNRNRRIFFPMSVNLPGRFNFMSARITDTISDNFFIALKSFSDDDKLAGTPIFNRNYVLQGLIKEKNNSYATKTFRDLILTKIGFQNGYVVNSVKTIRRFLDSFNVEYSVISGNANIANSKYAPKDSVVNIICVKPKY